MDYLHESAGSIYRRRRRRRMVVTMSCVTVLLFGTVVYAASYVQGWVGKRTTKAVVNTSCSATSSQALTPGGVTINVYNSTDRTGLAASVAGVLQKQGFKVATTDNDPLGKSDLGVGEIRYGPSGLEGANLAALRLPGATLVPDGRMDASVDIVLGKMFKAVKVRPKITIVTKAKPTPHC